MTVKAPEIAIQYRRRSGASQEDSLEQQGSINDAYIAAHGYAAPASGTRSAWEETGSGRSFQERPVFQALLRAVESHEVVAHVLVMYRPNRFGRSEDLTEFHYYEHRFKKAGVRIEYASGAEYNAPGLAGHITRAVAFAQAGEYSKNLSVDSTRGLLENARHGFSTGGEPCLGFDRMLVDRSGKQLGLLPRGARKGNDRNLKVVYVPSAEPGLVDFVRAHLWQRPFDMGWGAAKTARELNKLLRKGEGFPPPRAGRVIRRKDGREVEYTGTWRAGTILAMWTEYTYIGWRSLVIEADNEFRGEQVLCKTAHEPLLDEVLFWAMFERAKRRPWNERKMGPHRRREPGRYPLSGLGKCVHCGFGFGGSRTSNKEKGHTQLYYRDVGETNAHCEAPRWAIPVATFDPWVRERIVERLRAPAFQEALMGLLRDRLMPDEPVTPTAAASKRLRDVEKAIENLLNIATHTTQASPALAARLDALEAERASLSNGATTKKGPRFTTDHLKAVAEEVTRLSEELLTVDPEVFSEIAPRFLKEFRVNKETRTIEAEFYAVPGLLVPRSRIGEMEAAGVEPASEATQPLHLRA